MKCFRLATVVAGLSVGCLVYAGQAGAVAGGSSSAVDTVAKLEAEGYHVQLNGSVNVPLSQCKATGVHGLRNSNVDSSGSRIDEDLYTTIYVDVDCQDG